MGCPIPHFQCEHERPPGSGECHGDAAISQRAAEEDAEKTTEALCDSDVVFSTAGLGGGTGSAAAP